MSEHDLNRKGSGSYLSQEQHSLNRNDSGRKVSCICSSFFGIDRMLQVGGNTRVSSRGST